MKLIWRVALAFAVLAIAAALAVLVIAPRLASPQLVSADASASARGRYVFTNWDGPDLPVWYQLPDHVAPDTPVVFVMHGVNRDADRYRDEWADLARSYGFVLIVPEFAQQGFPGSRGYNTGNFIADDLTPIPRAQWSFSAIEPLFDDARERFGTRVGRYTIYGHSAGAQFVHRYVMFTPEARIDQAIAANAGWYTMPELATGFPYGLGEAPVDEGGLIAALGKRVTVMLGTADTDTNDPNLRKTPEANAQGPHRFARGQQFFAQGQQTAATLGTRFGWRLVTVPDVGHSNGKMAKAAAQLIAAE